MSGARRSLPPPACSAVYLAPHLDDAILSCGGQIAERAGRGEAVLVATVFAGDPPSGSLPPLARRLHRSWGGHGEPMEHRRREDEEACRRVGAAWLHWNLPDAIYRRSAATGDPLNPPLRELLGSPNPEDDPLVEKIAERLAELPEHRELVVPLGVGSHVDHLLARRAAERRFGRDRLIYFEDYPYAEDRAAVERALTPAEEWRSTLTSVGALAARAKANAVVAYRSQMWSLFRGKLLAQYRLWRSWRRSGGERLWTRLPEQRSEAPATAASP